MNDAAKAARPGSTKGSTAKKKATPTDTLTGNALANIGEVHWKLRLVNSEGCHATWVKDIEQEERYRRMKEKWETHDPGRGTKARESRESFVKAVQEGTKLMTSLPSSSTSTDISAVPHGKPIETDYGAFLSQLKTEYGKIHDATMAAKQDQLSPLTSLAEHTQASYILVDEQRSTYRKLLSEREPVKPATAADEMKGDPSLEESSASKKKKGAKK
jgi:hypothetical protein